MVWIARRCKCGCAELEEELERLDDEIQDLNAQVRDLDAGLNRYEESDAADHAQNLSVQAAEIREEALRYARLRLSSVVLEREVERYREQNQGPVLKRANVLFPRLTLGRFRGLRVGVEERQIVLLREDGKEVLVDGLSEGARYQLYLALRIASLERYLERNPPLPLVLDDILIHSDDDRAAAALGVLGELAERMQILFFTHHARDLTLARRGHPGGQAVPARALGRAPRSSELPERAQLRRADDFDLGAQDNGQQHVLFCRHLQRVLGAFGHDVKVTGTVVPLLVIAVAAFENQHALDAQVPMTRERHALLQFDETRVEPGYRGAALQVEERDPRQGTWLPFAVTLGAGKHLAQRFHAQIEELASICRKAARSARRFGPTAPSKRARPCSSSLADTSLALTTDNSARSSASSTSAAESAETCSAANSGSTVPRSKGRIRRPPVDRRALGAARSAPPPRAILPCRSGCPLWSRSHWS